MAGLSNIIKRIQAGNEAAKSSLTSGASREEAAAAGRAAAGVQTPVQQNVPQAINNAIQSIDNEYNQRQEQIASSPTDYGNEEKEETAFNKDEDSKKAKQASHKYDALRDYGGLIPLIGPILSGAGSFANWMDTGPMEQVQGATSSSKEAVDSGEYVSDPNILAMPSASDINTSFPTEEARNQYLSNIAEPLDSFIGEAMAVGIGSGLAQKFAKKSTDAAAKTTNEVNKAIKNNVDIGDMLFEDASKLGEDVISKDFVKQYIESLPKDIQDYVYTSVPYATRAGKFAGAKTAANLKPIEKTLQDAANIKYNLGQGLGQAIERLGRPLLRESSDFSLPIKGGDGGNPEPQSTDKLTSPTGKNTSQIKELVDWATTTPEGQEFARSNPWVFDYMLDPDNLMSFNADDYLNSGSGYGRLFGTNDRDLYAYLLGLNGQSQGIQGWRNRYQAAGVDLDAEDALDQLMNYIFGENAIDIANINDPRMQYGNYGPEAIANAQIARYLSQNHGFYSPLSDQAGWDPSDFAQYMLVANMLQNGSSNLSLDDLNAIWGQSGDPSVFGYIGSDGVKDERESRKNTNKRGYNLNNIISNNIEPWIEGGSPTYDETLVDAAIQSWNASHPEKEQIGLKY